LSGGDGSDGKARITRGEADAEPAKENGFLHQGWDFFQQGIHFLRRGNRFPANAL
jgi:hypothetical protein